MLLLDGSDVCARCGAALDMGAGEEPRVVIFAASGKPNVRVLSIDGREVHSCEFGGTR